MLPHWLFDIQNNLSRVFKKYFCLEEQKPSLYLLLMKVYPGILFLFVIYLTFWVDQNNSDYSNGAGYCRNYYTHVIGCHITNNDTQSIKTLLSNGSQGSTSRYQLYVYKRYSSDSGYLTLDFNTPPNIRSLILLLSNSGNHDQIILKTSTINTKIEYMYCNRIVHLESGSFFNQFVGLTRIQFKDVVSTTLPSFIELENLVYLKARLKFKGNHVLDSSFVSGLSNLRSLELRYSSFESIMEGALEDMDSLSHLYLDHNKISSIKDGALRGLTYLIFLDLEDNGLRDVSYNVFKDLSQLTYLNLNENPEFPIPALILLKDLKHLYLNFNNYQTLEPYVFQQLIKLTRIYMNNPFTCDCNLRWTSQVKQFGLFINNGYCLDPIDAYGKSILNEDSYTNCTQTQSYQCFNNTVICENNEVCHNTKSGYSCGCPIGYELNNIGHCGDIDECDEANQCQHSCVNTDGTFYCACNEGYRLSDNGYGCEDINECQEGIEECEHGCQNSIGSYQCYCEVGQQLYNKTNCNNDVQCELIGNSYDPLNCINEGESFLNCNSGLNLWVTNLPCVSAVVSTTCNVKAYVQQPTISTNKSTTSVTTMNEGCTNPEWINPALIFLIIPFIIVSIQTIVIIILIVCILKRNKSLKNHVTAPAIRQPSIPNNPTVNPKYEMFNDAQEIDNPEQIPPSMYANMANQTELHSNMTIPELYPGEASGYIYLK